MNHFQVNPIGTIHHSEEGPCIRVDNAYIPALKALEGFSHINVIWWFDRLDDEKSLSLIHISARIPGGSCGGRCCSRRRRPRSGVFPNQRANWRRPRTPTGPR